MQQNSPRSLHWRCRGRSAIRNHSTYSSGFASPALRPLALSRPRSKQEANHPSVCWPRGSSLAESTALASGATATRTVQLSVCCNAGHAIPTRELRAGRSAGRPRPTTLARHVTAHPKVRDVSFAPTGHGYGGQVTKRLRGMAGAAMLTSPPSWPWAAALAVAAYGGPDESER